MKSVASIKFVSVKNCIGIAPSSVLKDNCETQDIFTFRVSAGEHSAYVSLTLSVSQSINSDWLCISGLYATKLGFSDGSSVLLESVEPQGCARAWIAPVSVDDWEILEIHAGEVERKILDQIRIVYPGQTFPIWISENICIFLKTNKVEPAAECSLLMPLTELYIEPKTNRNDDIAPETKYISRSHDISSKQDETIEAKLEKEKTAKSDLANQSTQTNIVTKSKALLYVVYVKCFQNVFQIFRSLIFGLWKYFPHIFRQFFIKLYSFGESKKLKCSLGLQHEWVENQISSLPSDFAMVARVEPVLFEQSSFEKSCQLLVNQPNTIFLHSTANMENCQPDVYLVLMCKYLSPFEKLSENRIKKTKTAAENPVSGNEVKNCLDQCVVRMYLHPQSKYAMESNWKLICESHRLKVPGCVRRQMNLSVSSKVCLKKITTTPSFCSNVAEIKFDLKPIASLLSHNISDSIIIDSFQNWISGISDDNNPIPVYVGGLFIFPVVINDSDYLVKKPNEIVIEAVVSFIKSKNQAINDQTDSATNTFFLSGNDFARVKLSFTESNDTNFLPTQVDVDLKIPAESILVYCKGLEAEVKALQRFVELALSSRPLSAAVTNSGNLLRQTCTLVTGAKGTGKTVLCRSLLNHFASDNSLHAYVYSVACGAWRGKKPESVKKICDELLYELLWRQPSILLLDDLDQVVPASINDEEENTPDNLYTLQLVSVIKPFFLALCGGLPQTIQGNSKVAVLVTSKSKNSLHPSLTTSASHLFGNTVHIELPNFEKRAVMFKGLVENSTSLQCPVDLNEVIERTEGFAIGDLVSLVQKSNHLVEQKKVMRHFTFNAEGNDIFLCSDILNRALDSITPASLQSAKLHKPLPLTWSNVGGLEAVKQKLQEQLVWPVKYRHVFSECGLQPQSGVLLFGPPGCGKTLIASVVANECGLNFISIKGPEVLSKYIGASEAAVRDLFSRAKAASPCVLFFDEFDSLAPKRGHDSTGVTDRVVNQLLTHLDGVEPLLGVTVMAATSRPDLLDPALLRPGRLDNLLYCPFPNTEDRVEILKSLSSKLELSGDVDLTKLAQSCSDFSGADLKALLYNAQLEVVHENINLAEPRPHDQKLTLVTASDCNGEPFNQANYKAETSPTEEYTVAKSVDSDDFLKVTNVNLLSCNSSESSNVGAANSSDKTVAVDSDYFTSNAGTGQSKDNKQESSSVVYFSKLHQGRSSNIPLDVIKTTDTLFEQPEASFAPLAEREKRTESLPIASRHINKALRITRPSVTAVERQKFDMLYSNFVRSRDRSNQSGKNLYDGKLRSTLS